MANFGLTDLRLVAPARRLAQRQGARGGGRRGLSRRAGERLSKRRERHRRAQFRAGLDGAAARDGEDGAEPRKRGGRAQAARGQGRAHAASCSGLSEAASTTTRSRLPMRSSPRRSVRISPRLSLPQAVLLFGYEWLKAESAGAAARTRHRLRRARHRGHCLSRHAAGDAGGTARPVLASRSRARPIGLSLSAREAALDGARHPQHVPPHGRHGARCAHLARDRGLAFPQARAAAKKGVIVPPRFSYCDGRKRC